MTLRRRKTYRWKMLMWCIWCTLILRMNTTYFTSKKNGAWKWCALFTGNTGSWICCSVVKSMRYQLTGEIIVGLILFLVIICEIWKSADLWGFCGISEGIRNLANCTVYDSPLEGHSKVSRSCLTTLFYRAFVWPGVFANVGSTFHLALFAESVSLCLESSQG